MTIHEATLASDYAAAAGNFDKTAALQRFTEITVADKTACDAWIGRIACGDDSPTTLFRAWMSRHNLNRLASAAGLDLSVAKLNARADVGGEFADMNVAIRTATHLSVAYAIALANTKNFNDALEALEDVPADQIWGAWARAAIYAAGQRWDMVQDTINGYDGWKDPQERVFSAASELLSGVACAHMGLHDEALRRLEAAATDPYQPGQVVVGRSAAWHAAMCYRALGRHEQAASNLAWLQATYPSSHVEAAINAPKFTLKVTTRQQIQARVDPWNPESVAQLDDAERNTNLQEALALLKRQIGLQSVKEQVADLQSSVRMSLLRQDEKMAVAEHAHHLVFEGPPGTGKTTIAKVVAKIYAGLGIARSDKLVTKRGRELVAEWEGQTGPKTNAIIDSALDGVLFLDEIYTLVQDRDGRADPFGKEAADTLLARMEDDRDRLIVIIAGYRKDVQKFLDRNEGLRSRFTKTITFPTYSSTEIREIAEYIAGEKDSVLDDDVSRAIERDAHELLQVRFNDRSALDIAGNGRYARQLVEACERARDRRLDEKYPGELRPSRAELALVEHGDLVVALEAVRSMMPALEPTAADQLVEQIEQIEAQIKARMGDEKSDRYLEGVIGGIRHAMSVYAAA